MRELTKFDIIVREHDFLLKLEADGRETIELVAPLEQIEAIIDVLNGLVEDDEEDDEDTGETYQKPLG